MELTFESLRYLMARSPDAQGVHEKGVVLEGNRRLATLMGRTSTEELKGLRILDATHPDDRGSTLVRLRHHSESDGLAEPLEVRLLRPDGSSVHVQIQSSRLEVEGRTVVYSTLRDITARRQAEDDLRRQASNFVRAQKAASFGVWTEIPLGNVEWSDTMYRIFGLERPEDGRPPRDFASMIHPEDLPRVLEARRRLLETHVPFSESYRLLRKDGSTRWLHGIAEVEIDADGRPLAIGIVQDFTERHALEEQLLQSQKMEAVGRLAGGVAHDFNNLLVVMMGELELSRRALSAECPAQAHLAAVGAAVESAASLTRQLLTFSRRQVVQKRRLDVREAIQSASALARRLLGDDISLELSLASLPLFICADRAQLDQLVMNLLVNARDAMPHGGRILLRLHAEPGHAVLEVEDTGTGMTRQVREHIFEPFFTTKDAGRGTGLGLSTVYAVVQQSQGTIDVESEPGKGSRFRIRFPLAPTQVSTPEPTQDGPPHGRETILLVEDTANVRKVVARELEYLGYRVLQSDSGEKALALLQDESTEVEVLVSDLVMPGVSGSVLLEKARALKPGLRMVLVSGHTEGAPVRKLLQDSQVRFLAKPFLAAKLSEVIRELLDTSRWPPGVKPRT